jgi:hypothetical protein
MKTNRLLDPSGGRGGCPTLDDLKPETKRKFLNMEVVRNAVKYLAIKHSFPYHVSQSCANRYMVVCKNQGTKDGCPPCTFHIKGRMQDKLGGMVTIIKSNLTHSCGSTFTGMRKNRGFRASVVSKQGEGFIVDCPPKATPDDIRGHLKRTLGVEIGYRTAHQGRQLRVNEVMNNQVKYSFQYIEPLFQKIKTKMPGSVAEMEKDE